jgi:hypothetical protein
MTHVITFTVPHPTPEDVRDAITIYFSDVVGKETLTMEQVLFYLSILGFEYPSDDA